MYVCIYIYIYIIYISTCYRYIIHIYIPMYNIYMIYICMYIIYIYIYIYISLFLPRVRDQPRGNNVPFVVIHSILNDVNRIPLPHPFHLCPRRNEESTIYTHPPLFFRTLFLREVGGTFLGGIFWGFLAATSLALCFSPRPSPFPLFCSSPLCTVCCIIYIARMNLRFPRPA